MGRSKDSDVSGLLVIDKPQGPTSHDVVARLRKKLNTRAVGHAGTLDPMATGVLLVMVGECTKLSRFLTLEQKAYETTLRFGEGTDTFDALGKLTEQCPVPDSLRACLERLQSDPQLPFEQAGELGAALTQELGRRSQQPPSYSAIKQDGVAAYKLARQGQEVELAEREVRVDRLRVLACSASSAELTLSLAVTKGYYVRALARDLGKALGMPAHLTALRRIQSGPYTIEQAVPLEASSEQLQQALLDLPQVARALMPQAVLTPAGVRRALCGQKMSEQDFEKAPTSGVFAWFSPEGQLICVGDDSRGYPAVLRAFASAAAQIC